MKLKSSAFDSLGEIDKKFTVDGEDVSPPLLWNDVPKGTESLALICEDPDAPSPRNPNPEPWIHWLIFNIPGGLTELPIGIKKKRDVHEILGAIQGINSWPSANIGYRGPAPPPGSGPHRYFFKLFALDRQLDLRGDISKKQLFHAMQPHILAEAELVGMYERK